jgi:4-oxalocrotonate tautomerase
MPFINIAVAGKPLSPLQKQQLFDETTRLMNEVMRKDPKLTAVRIDQFHGDDWAVGRSTATILEKSAVHMDIKVTAGTNTEEEKEQMIRQAMEMLKEVVGAIPEASYIVIHELNATAWGYDGRTQYARASSTAT